MEKYKKKLGDFGEKKACEYLISKKYKIIEKNYRCKFGEIDLIALEGKTLVFIEVKTRSTDKYGTPSEAVNFFKRNHLIKIALNYISYRKRENDFCRFDVVEVFIKNADNNFETEKINLIKNAFIV